MRSILVALAVGNGTGPELLAIFEKVIIALAAPYNVEIRFVTSPRTYHSYSTLLAINDTDVVSSETLTDADHYEAFCREVVNLGACAVHQRIGALYGPTAATSRESGEFYNQLVYIVSACVGSDTGILLQIEHD